MPSVSPVVAAVKEDLLRNPEMPYAELGLKHGLKASRIARIAQDLRKTGVDPRSALVPKRVTLPKELCELAVEAVRVRLAKLGDPETLASETPRDLREAVRMLTEIYDLFGGLAVPTEDPEDEEEEAAPSLMSQLKMARTL